MRRQSAIVAAILLALAGLVWFATAQIAKGAYFHELDLRFTQGIVRTMTAMDAVEAQPGERQAAGPVREALLYVRQQPADCFAAVNLLDRAVMTAIGTVEAVRMCQSTIGRVDGFIASVERYRDGAIDHDAFMAEMTSALTYLKAQSERFVTLISKTVNFIVLSMTVTSVLFAIGVAIFVMRLLQRAVVAPIDAIQHVMQALAAGDKDIPIPNFPAGSEMGRMAATLTVFRANLIEKEQLQADAIAEERARKEAELRDAEAKQREIMERQEQERAEAQLRDKRAAEIEQLIAKFQHVIQTLLGDMNQSLEALKTESSALAAISNQSASQVAAVGQAAQTTTGNVETVAGAAQELDASIRGIAEQVQRQKTAAERADQDAEQTESSVAALAEEVRTIGEVIDIINGIAEQTNLLALNATIEAARAGEAGKGFAVVASEVKALANQTGKATETIAQKIDSVQGQTERCVEAIRAIARRINEISKIAGALENSVSEQSGATNEIARSVTEAAQGTARVSENMDDVNAAIAKSGDVAQQVLSVSQQIGERTAELEHCVQGFVGRVQAA
ncbi:MAG: hypothetical protein Tsb0016_12110 [Sphingomonadales bacterium]